MSRPRSRPLARCRQNIHLHPLSLTLRPLANLRPLARYPRLRPLARYPRARPLARYPRKNQLRNLRPLARYPRKNQLRNLRPLARYPLPRARQTGGVQRRSPFSQLMRKK